jgi:hypothetical protein
MSSLSKILIKTSRGVCFQKTLSTADYVTQRPDSHSALQRAELLYRAVRKDKGCKKNNFAVATKQTC